MQRNKLYFITVIFISHFRKEEYKYKTGGKLPIALDKRKKEDKREICQAKDKYIYILYNLFIFINFSIML